MNLLKFLISKVFFKQLLIMLIVTLVLIFGALQLLSATTHHNEAIVVPDLSKMKITIAKQKLHNLGLRLVVLDTVSFRKNKPPFSVVEQDPKAKSNVKEGRKIYVKINAGTYGDVKLPDLKEKTYRQVLANITSLGLQPGKKTYQLHIAKDIVLEVLQNGKILKTGDKIRQNSTLDFILGDGEKEYKHIDEDEIKTENE